MAENKNNQPNITYIIIAIIIAVSILGFGAMNYISSAKNQQVEQMKIQQSQKAQQKMQDQTKLEQNAKKQTLDKCLSDASATYDENWYRECKSQGLLTNKCISLHDMTFEEYANQNNIPGATENLEKRLAAITDFYKQRDDCSCRLPKYNADTNDKRLQDDKALCLKLYGTQ